MNQNIIELLTELCQTETPITLSSLRNSINIINESEDYDDYVAFKTSFAYGGWIKFIVNNKKYIIFFIPYDKKIIRLRRDYEPNDIVIIGKISFDGKDVCCNEKYCIPRN